MPQENSAQPNQDRFYSSGRAVMRRFRRNADDLRTDDVIEPPAKSIGRTGSPLVPRNSHPHPFRRKGPVPRSGKKLLALPVRGRNDEPIELRRDLDLATQPRVGLNLI